MDHRDGPSKRTIKNGPSKRTIETVETEPTRVFGAHDAVRVRGRGTSFCFFPISETGGVFTLTLPFWSESYG